MKNPMNLFSPFFWPFLFIHSLGPIVLLSDLVMAQNTSKVSVNFGVIVDNETWIGKMGLSCIEMAISEFYASNGHYKTRLVLHARHSKSDVVGAASAALDLIKNTEVQAMMGSMTQAQLSFIANLGKIARVPIISISTADPSLNRNSYFFTATPSVESQAKALSKIVKAFSWKKVVLIISDVMYGEGVIPSLTEALEEIDAYASYVSVVSSSTTDDELVEELRKLMKMQTRVFVVHADVSLGTEIFSKANKIGMMAKGYAWIVTNEITNFLSSMDSLVMDSMQGVLGIKAYLPETIAQKEFRARWKKLQLQSGFELNDFGLWAYDAATALAIAVEEVANNTNLFGFVKANASTYNSTDLESFGISKNGPELVNALSNLQLINDLSENFTLASTYQIVNVYGNGQKVVGTLTPQNERQPNLSNLAPIIWPGEAFSAPTGLEIGSSSSHLLRIGVPGKNGFEEFVKYDNDTSIGLQGFTGFSIDIYDAVLQELPYKLTYVFYPFIGSYNDLIHQVYLGVFDAAVGDITITANRSLYVDFTFPYSETGVSIIMPVILSNTTNSTWIFLKPWTRDLWITTTFFFIFNAFVVWVLEHRINKVFQGPLSYQIGTSLWFSFSTMAYAQREKIVNNLARFVVVVWIFVMLILTQCYAANLTSFLTVRQLQPPTSEFALTDLLRKGVTVGYGSNIVYKTLRELGFKSYQLRRYNTSEDARELMKNGDIAAIINEVPYNKLFHTKYCSEYGYYDVVDKRIRAEGFAFVFQRGSPLLPDFSRTLMKLRSGSEVMTEIENKWFGKKPKCKDPENVEGNFSNRLGLESFWGLFVISGVTSSSALAIHAITFFQARRRTIVNWSESSMWQQILSSLKLFHKRHSISHERAELAERRGNGSVVPVESIENGNTQPIG